MKAKTKYFVVADPWDYENLTWECATLKEAKEEYAKQLGGFKELYITRVIFSNQDGTKVS